MSRGSFGRSVARAAASGRSKSYRSRPAFGFYALIALIVIVGVGLVVYSRHQAQQKAAAASVSEPPTAKSNWNVAYAVDICGKLQANLPTNPNPAVGIRTFGNGLINIDPAASTTPSDFEGKKETLGLFASTYSTFKLTGTSIELPGKRTWQTLDQCTKADGPETGVGYVQAKLWRSPTDKHPTVLTGSAVPRLHLLNGEMVTIAFVPKHSSIPEPASKSALVAALGSKVSAKSTKKS